MGINAHIFDRINHKIMDTDINTIWYSNLTKSEMVDGKYERERNRAIVKCIETLDSLEKSTSNKIIQPKYYT